MEIPTGGDRQKGSVRQRKGSRSSQRRPKMRECGPGPRSICAQQSRAVAHSAGVTRAIPASLPCDPSSRCVRRSRRRLGLHGLSVYKPIDPQTRATCEFSSSTKKVTIKKIVSVLTFLQHISYFPSLETLVFCLSNWDSPASLDSRCPSCALRPPWPQGRLGTGSCLDVPSAVLGFASVASRSGLDCI